MKTLFISAFMLLTQLVYANESSKSVEASGKADIFVGNALNTPDAALHFLMKAQHPYLYQPVAYLGHSYEKIKLKVKYSFWAESKIKGEISISKSKKCPLTNTISFYGTNTGFGEFQIFSTPDDLVTLKNSIGTIINYEDSLSLILNKDTYFLGFSNKVYFKDHNKLCLRGFSQGSIINMKSKI